MHTCRIGTHTPLSLSLFAAPPPRQASSPSSSPREARARWDEIAVALGEAAAPSLPGARAASGARALLGRARGECGPAPLGVDQGAMSCRLEVRSGESRGFSAGHGSLRALRSTNIAPSGSGCPTSASSPKIEPETRPFYPRHLASKGRGPRAAMGSISLAGSTVMTLCFLVGSAMGSAPRISFGGSCERPEVQSERRPDFCLELGAQGLDSDEHQCHRIRSGASQPAS